MELKNLSKFILKAVAFSEADNHLFIVLNQKDESIST